MAQSNGFLPYWGAGFDPSQAENPYSLYKGAAFPRSPTFRGAATDAKGNVIQSYADAAAQQAPAASPIGTGLASTSGGGGYRATNKYNMPDNDMQLAAILDPNGFGSSAFAKNQMQSLYNQNGGQGTAPADYATWGQGGGQSANAAAAQGAQQQSPDMAQAYLDALQSPGKVTTPGAQVAQGPLPSQQSNVLDQFIANWKKNPGATQGAGGYSNQPFLSGIGAA